MSQFDCDKLMSSLQSEVDYSNFKDVDIVIEAVFEDINLKHRIIKEVWSCFTCVKSRFVSWVGFRWTTTFFNLELR